MQMQFFNDELFQRKESHPAYHQYWVANADRMPEELLRINGGMLPEDYLPSMEQVVFLHDARITSAKIELPNFRLQLDCDHFGGLRKTTLEYGGVKSVSPIPELLLEDRPESDLMCHETTINDQGLFEHRMLFASLNVLCVVFREIKLEIFDVEPPSSRRRYR